MIDETPEIVAAASLSPVSPRPLHNTYTLPQVLPGLQHQAEDPDVVPFEPPTFRTAAAAMASEHAEQAPLQGSGSDSELSEVASIADDESFGYGDGDGDGDGNADGNAAADVEAVSAPGQESAPQEAAQEADDYARTFDSPAAEKEQLAEIEAEDDGGEVQQPVSNAPESMNISQQPDQPDAVPNQPVPIDSSAPSLAEQGSQSQSSQPTTSSEDRPVPEPKENGRDSTAAPHEALPDAPTAAFPDQQTAAPTQPDNIDAAVQPGEAPPKQEDADVQPNTEDVEMTTEAPSDATALDIQKLVDQITAKAEATSDPPSEDPTPPAVQSTSQSMDVDMSSLPPKPALTQEQSKQTYSPASYHHASLPTAPSFPASTGVSSQPPPYANTGAPGTTQSQNLSATPSFASYPNAFPPGTAPQQAPGQAGNGLQQTYDEFLADERRHMAEAKWERFPDGSRIFIGKLTIISGVLYDHKLTTC